MGFEQLIAEVSGKVKRSMGKLRAWPMAAIVINYDHTFMGPLLAMRKQAWESIGLYWEHSLGFAVTAVLHWKNVMHFSAGWKQTFLDTLTHFIIWQEKSCIVSNKWAGVNTRFFAFNPLGWERTDYADFRYEVNNNIHVLM